MIRKYVWDFTFNESCPVGNPHNICLTCIFAPAGLGVFCASGAQRQHKMWQRKCQVEAVVRCYVCI